MTEPRDDLLAELSHDYANRIVPAGCTCVNNGDLCPWHEAKESWWVSGNYWRRGEWPEVFEQLAAVVASVQDAPPSPQDDLRALGSLVDGPEAQRHALAVHRRAYELDLIEDD